MKNRSEEIVKQLNRLANDRNLAPPARNKIRDAIQHIRDLHVRMIELQTEDETEIPADHYSPEFVD